MAGTTQYKNDWQKTKLDRINLTVPKGQKKQIQEHASTHDESTNGFINRAICEAMERDQIFEQNREKNLAAAQKYAVEIDEREAKRLAVAFAILEPQIPSIMDNYFFKIQLHSQSDGVQVYELDRKRNQSPC